jgi:hypothetical protein
LNQTKWSLPSLKAPWFDDEGIAPVDVAFEPAKNQLKPPSADVAVDGFSVQAFFDRFSSSSDEPATG